MADTKSTKTNTTKPVEATGGKPGDNGTSKPASQFTSDDNIAEAKAAAANDDDDNVDPAVDGVAGLEPDEQVAERSPDGNEPGMFIKAFILDRLDLDADGKVPDGFDHNPNIDGTRSFGVQSGVRFTGPIELLHNVKSKVAPGTRVLTYGGPAVPAGTIDDETDAPVRDYYDPEVVDAGEPDEYTESNSAEATDQAGTNPPKGAPTE